MQVGDLVCYTYRPQMMGVILGKCPMIGSDNYFHIQWVNGEKFPESLLYLEVVKN